MDADVCPFAIWMKSLRVGAITDTTKDVSLTSNLFTSTSYPYNSNTFL